MADRAFDQVLRAAQAGDGRAFEELYTSLQGRLHAFAEVRGASDPEALVNDVFLKVFTNVGTFAGSESQFSGWVFKIARNQLIDEFRKGRRRVDQSVLGEEHEPATPGTAETDALALVGEDWVAAQLSVLTHEQRDVVLLRVVSGLTIEEIAEVLDKRVGAIKAMQRRAFRALARNLERQAVPQ